MPDGTAATQTVHGFCMLRSSRIPSRFPLSRDRIRWQENLKILSNYPVATRLALRESQIPPSGSFCLRCLSENGIPALHVAPTELFTCALFLKHSRSLRLPMCECVAGARCMSRLLWREHHLHAKASPRCAQHCHCGGSTIHASVLVEAAECACACHGQRFSPCTYSECGNSVQIDSVNNV